jgi:hypothetical protein
MQAVALRVWSGFTSNLQKEPLCLPWAWGPLIDSAWRGPLPDFQVHLPDAHGVCVQHPEHAPQRFTSPQTLPCAQVPGPPLRQRPQPAGWAFYGVPTNTWARTSEKCRNFPLGGHNPRHSFSAVCRRPQGSSLYHVVTWIATSGHFSHLHCHLKFTAFSCPTDLSAVYLPVSR